MKVELGAAQWEIIKNIYIYIYPHGLIIAHKKARMADTTMFTSPPAAPSPSSTPRT